MVDCPLAILQVSTADIGGGAERVAWNLFQSYKSRGHDSWLAVGRKLTNDCNVLEIRNGELHGSWSRAWLTLSRYVTSYDGTIRGAWRLGDLLRGLAEPRRWFDESRGIEDFHFPGTRRLLQLAPQSPEIVHLHNLHGYYFDLRLLPWLATQLPLVLTLHDGWLLSGHCAHSLECERWKTGCGRCPDLTIYPSIRRDMSDYNWRRKRDLYARSRLYVATPSQWLMDKVKQSILEAAIVEARVIPNGVDLTVFHNGDQNAARAALGIPQNAKVVLFAAAGIRQNVYKDFNTIRTALSLLGAAATREPVVFLAVGEEGPKERLNGVELRYVGYFDDPELIARYYQAADVYLHAARADTFPNSVIEALACGTPVLATAVGGIPEQVKALEIPERRGAEFWKSFKLEQATGILVRPGDAEAMAAAIETTLNDEALRHRLGSNAAVDARQRFDLNKQVDAYLLWYRQMLSTQSRQVIEACAV